MDEVSRLFILHVVPYDTKSNENYSSMESAFVDSATMYTRPKKIQ